MHEMLQAMVVATVAACAAASAMAQSGNEFDSLQAEVSRLSEQGKYAESLALQRAVAERIEKAETAETGKSGAKTARALGNLAWRALHTRNFTEALAASERAHVLAPQLLWIEANRAHALLFLGHEDEARVVYLAHKGKRPFPNNDAIWEDVIDEDFAALRKIKLNHAAFNKVAAGFNIDARVPKQQFDAVNKETRQLFRAGKYAEALSWAERGVSLARQRYGENRLPFAVATSWLAEIYRVQGRAADAEPLYKRAITIVENALGSDHPDVGVQLNNLALLYQGLRRYAEAEPLYRRALATAETLGPDHPDLGTQLNNLALLYRAQGRYTEAEPLTKRALAIAEKTLGSNDPQVATRVNNLAALYRAQGRYAEAEPLYKRALAIAESQGPDHRQVGIYLNNLAELYRTQRRFAEAEPLYKRAVAIAAKASGAEQGDVGVYLNTLASLYRDQGRYAEAEPLYKRALTIAEKALGPDHPDFGTHLANMADLYRAQGRYIDAELLLKRALAIAEKALGPNHPYTADTLGNLAHVHFEQRDWAGAADIWRRSTGITVRRTRRGSDDVGQALAGKGKTESQQSIWQFGSLIKALYRLTPEDRTINMNLVRETFLIAQWPQGSEAAASLVQMAARGARDNTVLAALVRERQDLAAEWQARDGLRNASFARAPDQRDHGAETANVTRLTAIDRHIGEIDRRLKAEFPNYASLARPEPLSVAEVQDDLRPDEVLVLFFDTPEWKPTPEETFIWVVTKTDVRWVRSDIGTAGLVSEVTALHCGLDASAWDEQDSAAGCNHLVKSAPERDASGSILWRSLPFDTVRAQALYQTLFGKVEDLIRDKHLLIVPSGPLTQFSFQVLVTAKPDNARDYRSVQWLPRKHALTVLPAVSALRALRGVAKASAATKPMIGFGNPLLDGDPAARPWEARWARTAREKTTCPQSLWQRMAGLQGKQRRLQRVSTRGGLADLNHVRAQMPLPDTADELCAVAKELGAGADDVLLGDRATETTIKKLSKENKLAAYRMLHFATHGTVAGEIEGSSEPGLILTPPKDQSELDDGFLSASEVAALRLDADWVILSACNTAADGGQRAGALSGLARAFIYAGARSLLVSFWSVDSVATVKLITAAAPAGGKSIGRAEALRRAMLAMIDKGAAHESHPSYWAPFVLVGEGATAK